MVEKTQSVLKRSHEVTEKRGGVFKASSASEIAKKQIKLTDSQKLLENRQFSKASHRKQASR